MPPAFARADGVVRAHLGKRYSAAVLRIDVGGKPRYCGAYGMTYAQPGAAAVYADTRFDIASLTKLFVSTVALARVRAGSLHLDAALSERIPLWRGTQHATVSLRMLLAHIAGFRSGADYRTLLGRNVETFALTEPLASVPGAKVVYSDLGFIALGHLVAQAHGTSLAHAVHSTLGEYGAHDVRFAVAAGDRAQVAATEFDAWRGLVHGVVHDEKAYLMNGVAGHAGLFAPVADVARLGEWYLAAVHRRPTPLDPGLARLAIAEAAPDPILRRGLGWALKTTADNSCGAAMSANAFGHTGFTGTSIWIDPQRDLSVVLLTNAVHFGRSDMRAIRAAVCDAAVAGADA